MTSSTLNLAFSSLLCSFSCLSVSVPVGKLCCRVPLGREDASLTANGFVRIVRGVWSASTATQSLLRRDRRSLSPTAAVGVVGVRGEVDSPREEGRERSQEIWRSGVERKWGLAREVSTRREDEGRFNGRRLERASASAVASDRVESG